MASRIITKKGSGAPLASDLVHGELAVDTVNKRLYTEDAGGTVIEVGTAPSTIDINAGTIDGTVIGGSTAAAITGTTITGTSFVSSGDMTFGDNDKAVFGAGSDLQIYHDGSNSRIVDSGTGILTIQASSQLGIYNSDGTQVSAEFVNDGKVGLRYSGSEKLATTSTGIDVTGTVTADGGTIVSTGSDAFSAKAVGGYAIQAYQDATSADHTALDLRSDATTGTRYLIRGYNDAAGTPTEVFSVGADGTVTADGLTVDGDVNIADAIPILRLDSPAVAWAGGEDLGGINWYTEDASGDGPMVMARLKSNSIGANTLPLPEFTFQTSVSSSALLDRLKIHNNGDISFYEDTGTTAKFFWDASAESLGIGSDTNSNYALSISENNPTIQLRSAISTGSNTLLFSDVDSAFVGYVKYYHSNNSLAFATNGIAGDDVTIDSAGNVGIGTSSPAAKLEIGGAGEGIILASPDGTRYEITVANGGTLTVTAV